MGFEKQANVIVKQSNVEKHRSAQRETEQQIDSDQSILIEADLLPCYIRYLYLV
jgi:hypothetical protein